MTSITSLENPAVKYAYRLKTSPSFSKKEGRYLAEGRFNFDMALKAGVVDTVFTPYECEEIGGITYYLVSEAILHKLSSLVNSNDVIFICKMKEIPLVNEDKLLYLDDIRDPGNMGTILRTALALGMDGVVLSPNCVSIYNEKVISASKGAIFSLPIVEKDIHAFTKTHTIYVTCIQNEDTLTGMRVKTPFILVLGNEAHGVSNDIISLADYKVSIKMNNIDSLNVGVAAGIIMFYFLNPKVI